MRPGHRCSWVPAAPGPRSHAAARALLSQKLHWEGTASCPLVQRTKGQAHLNQQADTSAHHMHSSGPLYSSNLKGPSGLGLAKFFSQDPAAAGVFSLDPSTCRSPAPRDCLRPQNRLFSLDKQTFSENHMSICVAGLGRSNSKGKLIFRLYNNKTCLFEGIIKGGAENSTLGSAWRSWYGGLGLLRCSFLPHCNMLLEEVQMLSHMEHQEL